MQISAHGILDAVALLQHSVDRVTQPRHNKMVFDGRTAVYLQAHVAQSHFVYFAREFQTSPDIHAFWNDISDSVARQGGLNEIFRKAGEAANGVFNPAPSTTSWVAGARYTLRAPADFPSSPQELVNYSVNVGFRPGFPRSLLDTYSHTLSWNGRTVSFRVPKVPYLFAEHLIALHGRVVRAEKSAARPEDVADTIVLLYAIYGANRWAWPTTLPWRELGEAGSSFAQLTGIGSSLRLFATNPPWVPRVLSSAVGALSTSAEQRSRIQRALDELQPVAQNLYSSLYPGLAAPGRAAGPALSRMPARSASPSPSLAGSARRSASPSGAVPTTPRPPAAPLSATLGRPSPTVATRRAPSPARPRPPFPTSSPAGAVLPPLRAPTPARLPSRAASSVTSASTLSRPPTPQGANRASARPYTPAALPQPSLRPSPAAAVTGYTARATSPVPVVPARSISPVVAASTRGRSPTPVPSARGRSPAPVAPIRTHSPVAAAALPPRLPSGVQPGSRLPGGSLVDLPPRTGPAVDRLPRPPSARPAAPAPSRNLPPLRRTPSAAELHSRRAQSPARAFPSSGDNLPDPAPFPSHLYSPSGRPLYATSPSARTASSVPFSATDTALERNGFAPWPGRQRRPSTSGLVPQPRYGGGY